MADPRHCLVLGGSGYVGSAVVRGLAAAGARVSFTWHTREAEALALQAATGATPLQWAAGADTAPLQALGPLAALVQCIGTAGDPALYTHSDGRDKFLALTPADWQGMQDITVTSSFSACQALVPQLVAPANIVLVGSMDGVKSVPAPVHYAAGKAALAGMAHALAKALGPSGICTNLVAAGILEGGLGQLLSEPLKAQYLKHCGLHRLGRADEVAALVCWLALRNTYLNGQAIVLDGGL